MLGCGSTNGGTAMRDRVYSCAVQSWLEARHCRWRFIWPNATLRFVDGGKRTGVGRQQVDGVRRVPEGRLRFCGPDLWCEEVQTSRARDSRHHQSRGSCPERSLSNTSR
jgi:hypothetical protein